MQEHRTHHQDRPQRPQAESHPVLPPPAEDEPHPPTPQYPTKAALAAVPTILPTRTTQATPTATAETPAKTRQPEMKPPAATTQN
jgi:hypothetical protein